MVYFSAVTISLKKSRSLSSVSFPDVAKELRESANILLARINKLFNLGIPKRYQTYILGIPRFTKDPFRIFCVTKTRHCSLD